ncbi:3-oxoacyl-[acyl-carrier-protein] synthase 1 [Hafnia alvei]|uniref:3-oxoacyl-[acyl-carrier-protein] synthase 1 n=1 Tax=Hafnia alvei TaxID=569 RepID=A0A377PKE7_HAFAL|nr:3-oxoacyl-[acyl-carrier-protein] synthase 1 [Hafnia alvei]
MRSHVWGNIKLDTTGMIDRKVMRFMSDASIYAYLSMQEAIKDSGLADDMVSNDRTGLIRRFRRWFSTQSGCRR